MKKLSFFVILLLATPIISASQEEIDPLNDSGVAQTYHKIVGVLAKICKPFKVGFETLHEMYEDAILPETWETGEDFAAKKVENLFLTLYDFTANLPCAANEFAEQCWKHDENMDENNSQQKDENEEAYLYFFTD